MRSAAGCQYYTIFRRCITGANEYRYYHKGVPVGNAVAMVANHYPILITGSEYAFCCDSDIESTICPGYSRSILYKGHEYAKITYMGYGQHCLQIGEDTIQVRSDQHGICFYRNHILLAILYTLFDTAGTSDIWEQRQNLCVYEDIPKDYLLLMLSFSLLQIGI